MENNDNEKGKIFSVFLTVATCGRGAQYTELGEAETDKPPVGSVASHDAPRASSLITGKCFGKPARGRKRRGGERGGGEGEEEKERERRERREEGRPGCETDGSTNYDCVPTSGF